MKRNAVFMSVIMAAAAMTPVFAAKKPKPQKLLKGESITRTLQKKKLSEKVLARPGTYEDKTDAKLLRKKYITQNSTNWNCHDPKIFQDDDGTYYVYSTGWRHGAYVRSSKDLVSWTLHQASAFWDPKEVSLNHGHMHWDDEFLKWTGIETNDGDGYNTGIYKASPFPESWAPTVTKKNGKYYMFHGIIRDCETSYGKLVPAACISLSIADSPEGPFIPAARYDPETYKSSTLVRYTWENDDNTGNSAIGYNKCKNVGLDWESGFGGIDPEFVMDIATGELMEYEIGGRKCHAMTYGSWKDGIALVYVDAETFRPVNQKTGEVMDDALDSLSRNSGLKIAGGKGAAYEGSQLIYNSDTKYYYIFVSMGNLEFDYRVGVGRSEKIEGPYLDANGQHMKFETMTHARNYHAIGSKLIGGYKFANDFGGFTAPGGQSMIRNKDGKLIFACHARTDWLNPGQFCLQIREMFFNTDGWPVLDINEISADERNPVTMKEAAGTYHVIITRRDPNPERADKIAEKSRSFTIEADGTVSGDFKGKAILKDGAFILDLGKDGVFNGLLMEALDFALRKPTPENIRTITFTALNSTKGTGNCGEYIFGNRAAD